MNKLDITSKEVSSLKEMDLLFEDYCQKSGITLDLTKDPKYNAYSDEDTGNAFCWFLHGIFRAIGEDYLNSFSEAVKEKTNK